MPPPYAHPHWGRFVGIPRLAAGPVGSAPSAWFTSLHVGAAIPAFPAPLPALPRTRTQVRTICHPPHAIFNPPLFDWACSMSWGVQRRSHGRSSYAHAHALIPKLLALRAGGLTRADAYNLFLPLALGGGGNINGLGPAFFTKLLYFFSPHLDFFIMDQWVAKSVNLLTGNWVVRLNPDGTVSNLNRCGNYAAFCWEVDQMAALLGHTGSITEELLFSKGARPPPIWPWRGYLKANWSAATAAFPPYNAHAMCAVYGPLTGLPLGAFR